MHLFVKITIKYIIISFLENILATIETLYYLLVNLFWLLKIKLLNLYFFILTKKQTTICQQYIHTYIYLRLKKELEL
jgi:hypothetical protein